MAKPRIFVSSTYYDLKHVRSSLENFVESLGFDVVLSEKGDIAFTPDTPLDESCYREVGHADVFVLIVGGRYGSEKSEGKDGLPKALSDRYDSITKQEYGAAVEKDIPVYILIEKAVYSDFETYLRNKDNKSINYAHVDSINIFRLIEEILAQPRNNPVQQFDRYAEIETWLREQWAGLFRELLSRMSSQKQISSLASQVTSLAEINNTLKAYLEQVVQRVAPDQSAKIIQAESERLEEASQLARLEENLLVQYLTKGRFNIPTPVIRDAVRRSNSLEEFVAILKDCATMGTGPEDMGLILDHLLLGERTHATRHFNILREIVGLRPLHIASSKDSFAISLLKKARNKQTQLSVAEHGTEADRK